MISEGRILTCSGGIYSVETAEGVIECYAKGGFRHDNLTPVPGDAVTVREEKEKNKTLSYIVEIKDRKNVLIRPALANLDVIFSVNSVCSPDPALINIDKILSVARHNGIEAVVIFTKADLDRNKADELYKLYCKTGIEVIISENTSPASTLERIKNIMCGRLSAFSGPSGAGKSTLLNALFPHLKLQTGEISKKIARGKNTTRQSIFYNVSELVGALSSYVADTPGFTQLDFERFHFMEKEELADSFFEFSEYLGTCKYTKCTHRTEEGCSIVKAVELEIIPSSRHQSYTRLYTELSKYNKWKK